MQNPAKGALTLLQVGLWLSWVADMESSDLNAFWALSVYQAYWADRLTSILEAETPIQWFHIIGILGSLCDVSIQGLGYFRFPVSIRTIFTKCLRVRPVRYVETTKLTININSECLYIWILDFSPHLPHWEKSFNSTFNKGQSQMTSCTRLLLIPLLLWLQKGGGVSLSFAWMSHI